MLLIHRAHQSRRRWQDFIDKDEDGLFRRELDSLADYIDELTDGEILQHRDARESSVKGRIRAAFSMDA